MTSNNDVQFYYSEEEIKTEKDTLYEILESIKEYHTVSSTIPESVRDLYAIGIMSLLDYAMDILPNDPLIAEILDAVGDIVGADRQKSEDLEDETTN